MEAARRVGLLQRRDDGARFRGARASREHPSAEEVFERGAGPDAALSATACEILGDVRMAGYVKTVSVGGKLGLDHETLPHHHLEWEESGRIGDLQVEGTVEATIRGDARRGSETLGPGIVFRSVSPAGREP